MATSVKHLIIFALVNSFLTITSVSSQCCTMNSDCKWNFVTDSWQYAPGHIPDTSTYYYNFLPTVPDGYYLWLQDQSGTISSDDDFSITAPGMTLSFDYYFQTPDPLPGDYLHVFLKNGLTSTRIASITVIDDVWRSYEITCDSSVNYCCGSLSDVPCSGTIEITATWDLTPNKGLVAIDNFGTCGPRTTENYPPTTTAAGTTTAAAITTTEPIVTTLSPYTVPPPHPDADGCCDFETDVCGFTISYPYWYWSATRTQAPPTPYIPPYDGQYFWTDEASAIATSSLQSISNPLHTFSITYYLNNANILVNFFETYPTSQKTALSTLAPSLITTAYWNHATYQADFCSGYPCQGYFTIEPLPLSGVFAVAIDDLDFDGRCHGSLPCCYFDDLFICDFIYPTGLPYNWQWSGTTYPTQSIPNPGSNFLYFEVSNTDTVVASVPLSSGLITIPQNVVFRGYFFARTPFGQAGIEALQLDFIEQTTLTVTTMEFVKDTSNIWQPADFYCMSIHGDCCQGKSSCQGWLELTATVQGEGGPLIYAIDAFGVKNICPLPGAPSTSDINSIPLHIKG